MVPYWLRTRLWPVDAFFGGAFGVGISTGIKRAYTYLARCYDKGVARDEYGGLYRLLPDGTRHPLERSSTAITNERVLDLALRRRHDMDNPPYNPPALEKLDLKQLQENLAFWEQEIKSLSL